MLKNIVYVRSVNVSIYFKPTCIKTLYFPFLSPWTEKRGVGFCLCPKHSCSKAKDRPSHFQEMWHYVKYTVDTFCFMFVLVNGVKNTITNISYDFSLPKPDKKNETLFKLILLTMNRIGKKAPGTYSIQSLLQND